ncbi:MAG: hypothetical protein ACI37J_03620 [Candidatus Bruticola sp.]
MTNKNTFRFATFAAVASLGLGLMISGCGDGGSTEPNPLNAKFGQVTFNYNVLAQTAANAKTDVAEDIVTVKYAFFGQKNGARFIDGPTDSYTFTFTHGEKDAYDDKVVKNVSLDASGVIAAYYDKDGNLVAMGENEVAFDDGKAVIEDPDLTAFTENTTVKIAASRYVLAPKDETVIAVTAVGGEKEYNITPFVTISGIDSYILAYVQDTNQGATYQGAEYGTIEANTIKATVNGTAYTIDKPIYVTDQTPNAIKIVADQVDGKDVTTVAATEEANEALTVVLAGEKSILANEKAVELTAEGKDAIRYAVNEQPIAVIATGYTNVDGKGPQPKDVETEIEDLSKITLVSGTEATAKAEGLNLIAAAEGNTVVTATYKVSDEETVESTNKLDVKVVSATENLAFSNTETKAFMTDVKVDADKDQKFAMAVAGKASLTVDDTAYVSAPIEYTAETYPAIVAVDEEGITYAQTEGKNEYTLTVAKTAAPAGAVEITVADTTPAFESIDVVKE